jgi:D-arginine dehydrogenase
VQRCDVIVIGGGIAGVGAAAELAERGVRVTLLEREAQLAMHTTGRSAAQYLENYGGPVNRALTLASREAFERGGFLAPRPLLSVGGDEQAPLLRREAALGAELVASIHLVDGEEARRWCPVLRPEQVTIGVLEPEAADIDVAALHQSFVRRARAAGAVIEAAAGEVVPQAGPDGWRAAGWAAPTVVNAAGAWGDVLATHAGIPPVGLRPLRRTAFLVPAPPGAAAWPLVIWGDRCYFKPESGPNLLCSPVDEVPSEPCDARAEEVDIARALDAINELTTLDVRHVRTAWAGLRTFAPDRNPVIGYAPLGPPGFFWLVGQGGTGIQTAPAQAAACATLVLDEDLPAALTDRGLTAAVLGPGRFSPSPAAEPR